MHRESFGVADDHIAPGALLGPHPTMIILHLRSTRLGNCVAALFVMRHDPAHEELKEQAFSGSIFGLVAVEENNVPQEDMMI